MDGTSDGVQTPLQLGVITKEGENFPVIPKKLLRMEPEKLQLTIDGLVRANNINRASLFYSPKLEERLEDIRFVCECAKIAVERRKAGTERL